MNTSKSYVLYQGSTVVSQLETYDDTAKLRIHSYQMSYSHDYVQFEKKTMNGDKC